MRSRLSGIVMSGALLAYACGDSGPISPARLPAQDSTVAGNAFGLANTGQLLSENPAVVDFGSCLAGSRGPACFSNASRHVSTGAISASVTAPAAPINLVATVIGNAVTLTWIAPNDPVVAYIIEAGSVSGGANLANFSTGNSVTAFTAIGVGAGTYFVRVRSVTTAAISGPSNEAVLVVGGCTSGLPTAPVLTLIGNAGGSVAFAWTTPSGDPSTYVIEAGSAPGLTNLANSDLRSATTTFTATGVAPGTYYVRIRAKNVCGIGPASNEVVVSILIVTRGIRWPVNGHTYEAIFVPQGISWTDANAAAQAGGSGWHLATITSFAENEFVASLVGNPSFWICCFSSNAAGPWIGGFKAGPRVGDYAWVTGEPFVYTNWGPFEPYGNGDRIAFFGFRAPLGSTWNDYPNVSASLPLPRGYIVEIDR